MKHQVYFRLLAIIALGFALRLPQLQFQPLWWDEGYSVFFATRDFWTMIERTAIDIHPPFYYALLQIWMSIVGKSDIAFRLLSVLIGVAAIPFLYALAERLFANNRIALVAALLFAISPFHIYYSQEIRMYGLVTLLGLVSVYLCVQLLGMTPGTRASAGTALTFILVTTAALYTQYYAAFVLAAEIVLVLAIYLVIDRRPIDWRSFASIWANPLLHWLTAWSIIALLYLPWIVYAGPKLYTYVTSKVSIEKYAPLDPVTFLTQTLAAFSVGHLTEWTWLVWGSIVLICFVILAFLLDAQRRRNANALLLPYPLLSLSPSLLVVLYLIVPLTFSYLVNLVFPFHPIRSERLLLIATPAFYLIAAIGIVSVWNLRARFAGLGLALIVLASASSLYDFYTVPRYPKDDYRPLIAEMQTIAQPSDTWLAIYPWQIGYLETYYTGAPLEMIETPNDTWLKNPVSMQNELDAILKKNSRVWVPALQTQGRVIEDAIDSYLRPRTYSIIDNWHGTTRLELFASASDPATSAQTLNFENQLALRWGISNEAVNAGEDFVRVWLDAGNVIAGSFKASLRLIDARGNIWQQDDREIIGGSQRIGLVIPLGTPPGEYAIRLQIYHARDGKPLQVDRADNIVLTRIQVNAPAQPNLAALAQRKQVDFGNGVRLLGFETVSSARPGEPTLVHLLWQATRAIEQEYNVLVQIKDARGKVYATTSAAPAHGIYPTSRWQPREIVRDPQTISLRGDTSDGNYRIHVSLIDTASQVRGQSIEIGDLNVKGRPRYFGAPSPSNKIDVRFGDIAQLVGYDVVENQRAVRIVLYWQAHAWSETSYKVFVHLTDSNGNLRAQRDQVPGNGAYPTTSWVKGEYLVDVYDIDAPPGEYAVRIGMYDPGSNLRLSVFDVANRVIGDYSELSTRISVK